MLQLKRRPFGSTYSQASCEPPVEMLLAEQPCDGSRSATAPTLLEWTARGGERTAAAPHPLLNSTRMPAASEREGRIGESLSDVDRVAFAS
jgi:hypothetical protein